MTHSRWAARLWNAHAVKACMRTHTHTYTDTQAHIKACIKDTITPRRRLGQSRTWHRRGSLWARISRAAIWQCPQRRFLKRYKTHTIWNGQRHGLKQPGGEKEGTDLSQPHKRDVGVITWVLFNKKERTAPACRPRSARMRDGASGVNGRAELYSGPRASGEHSDGSAPAASRQLLIKTRFSPRGKGSACNLW